MRLHKYASLGVAILKRTFNGFSFKDFLAALFPTVLTIYFFGTHCTFWKIVMSIKTPSDLNRPYGFSYFTGRIPFYSPSLVLDKKLKVGIL